MSLKIRFLLTPKCSATCAYCHNEGQTEAGASLLDPSQIERILSRLAQGNRLPDEIILSGGEPTLHKHLGKIAECCKATGSHLSMDSHGGHPELLKAALPHIDELKLHIDAFDPDEQRRSMGLDISHVETSIRAAQNHAHIKLLVNHPLADIQQTTRFVTQARARRIDCKIIDLFCTGFAPRINWQHQGYAPQRDGSLLHSNGTHRLYTKSCGAKHNTQDQTFFIGTDGVRLALDTPIIASVADFDPLAWAA